MEKRKRQLPPVVYFVVGGFFVLAALLGFVLSLLLDVELETAQTIAGLIMLAVGVWVVYDGIRLRRKMRAAPPG
jgi:putative Mn2+ efflux pump MntP